MKAKMAIYRMLAKKGLTSKSIAQDAVAQSQGTTPSNTVNQSLVDHDKRFHPNGYKNGDTCKLRDTLFSDANGIDNLTVPTNPTTGSATTAQQMPTQAEYDSSLDGLSAYEDFLPPDVVTALREYPKKASELAEVIEELQGIINELPDCDARNIGISELQAKEEEWDKLQKNFLTNYEAINGVFNVGAGAASTSTPAFYTPLKHDASQFPKKIDSIIDDGQGGKIVTVNGTQFNFNRVGGSTGATEGTIDINGKQIPFHLKTTNSMLSEGAIKNEFYSDAFLRSAGIKAPDGVLYDLGNGQFAKLTLDVKDVIGDLSNGIGALNLNAQQQKNLKEQLKAAYPLLDVMYHTDAFKNDNILVDKDGNPWFVDNGSSFLYRAQGGMKDSTWGGVDMTKRNNASDPAEGYGTLYGHRTQRGLREDIGKNLTHADLLQEAAKYNMEDLVSDIEKEYPQLSKDCPGLLDYARSLDKMADQYRKNLQPINASAKPKKISATKGSLIDFGSTTAQQSQQSGQSQTIQMTSLPGGRQIPTDAYNSILGLGGTPFTSTLGSGVTYNYSVPNVAEQTVVGEAQALADKLGPSNGFLVFTYGSGTTTGIGVAHTNNLSDIPQSWNATIYFPKNQGTQTNQTGSSSNSSSPTSPNATTQIQTGVSIPAYGQMPQKLKNVLNINGFGYQAAKSPTGEPCFLIGTHTNAQVQNLAVALPKGLQIVKSNTGAFYITNDTASLPSTWTQISSGSAQTNSSTPSQNSTPSTTQGTQIPSSLTSGTVVPQPISSLLNQLGISGAVPGNFQFHFNIRLPGAAHNAQALQTLADKLPKGLTVTTHSNGNGYIVNTSELNSHWNKYHHKIVQPTASANSSQQASYGTTASQQTSGSTMTPVSNQVSVPSQQQVASKPSMSSPVASSGNQTSTATSGGTKTYSYGWTGSLVKNGGMNDNNVATDISNLISGNNWQSKSGKQLIAPGTKLKTQGSLSNNGDLYVGFPRGTQQSDIANLAQQLNGEYQQYGYNVYAMGHWLSIENAQSSNTARGVSNNNPVSSPKAKRSTNIKSPVAQATNNAANQSQAQTTSNGSASAPVSSSLGIQPSASPSTGSTTQPPSGLANKLTLAQLLNRRMANANPQQQTRFQAAISRANGNSGSVQPQQPQINPSSNQTAQTKQTTPSGANATNNQTVSSSGLLTAPKSGNQPTPVQQKTIDRFNHQIQNAKTPAQKKAFESALSRYYGSI